jgi:hypothetical protein
MVLVVVSWVIGPATPKRPRMAPRAMCRDAGLIISYRQGNRGRALEVKWNEIRQPLYIAEQRGRRPIE